MLLQTTVCVLQYYVSLFLKFFVLCLGEGVSGENGARDGRAIRCGISGTEQSRKVKPVIYQSIFQPSCNSIGHDPKLMTDRIRSWIWAAEMRFFRILAGLSHRRPWGRPRTRWGDYISYLHWECLDLAGGARKALLGRGMSWISFFSCRTWPWIRGQMDVVTRLHLLSG